MAATFLTEKQGLGVLFSIVLAVFHLCAYYFAYMKLIQNL